MTATERLQALVDAEVLAPDLADEVRRLYAVEAAHEVVLEELVELRRHTRRVTVLNGELRDRLVRADRRLADLPVDAIANARRAAYFLGEGFVRIRHHGRGNYSAEQVPTELVTVRRGD